MEIIWHIVVRETDDREGVVPSICYVFVGCSKTTAYYETEREEKVQWKIRGIFTTGQLSLTLVEW